VEKKQYRLCEEVLRRLDESGVLSGVVVIGSWCVLFYEKYFLGIDYAPMIRTRDLDLAIPIPPRFKKKVDMTELLADLGFVIDFRGDDGYIRLLNPDLILEFLVPERGRPATKPFDIPALGINAQPLRYLDLLLTNTVQVDFRGLPVRLPHPVRFALHKLIVSERRSSEKAERDRSQAVMVLQAVEDSGEVDAIKEVFASLPAKWRRSIENSLNAHGDPGAMGLIGAS